MMGMVDVAARLQAVIAEPAHGESFTFVPYFRTGAAAGIRHPQFSTDASATARIDVSFDLSDGHGGLARVQQAVEVRGPGAVLGIDPAQIIRRYPAPGTADATTGDLAHIEFDQPDLPWLFTPTAPSGDGRLPPWLRLVVVPAENALRKPPLRPELPETFELRIGDLPRPDEAWGWAHAQVLGTHRTDAGLLARSLGSGSPRLNLSRLLAPRRLAPDRQWRAIVVPTFQAGVDAALGRAPMATLAWSWSPAAGPDSKVILPAYDTWEFATAGLLGFEELAERIEGVPTPEGLGRRLVDTSDAGMGVTGAVGPRDVFGALVAPGAETAPAPGDPGQLTAASEDRLRDLVDAPASTDADPEVGPPLYGGAHMLATALPAEGENPPWLAELNLDPAERIAAGLGTSVVRMDQEPLMAGAWSQLQNVLEANRVLNRARFAELASTALHRRTIARMSAGDTLGVTQRALAHIPVGDELTARGAVSASALPFAAAGATLRRIARPFGRVARFTAADERTLAATALLADDDGNGADWVLPVPGPGVLTHTEPMRLLEQGEGLEDVFHVDGEREAAAILADLLDALPLPEEIDAWQRDSALAGRLDDAAADVALAWGIARSRQEWELPMACVARFPASGLPPEPGYRSFAQDELRAWVFDPIGEEVRRICEGERIEGVALDWEEFGPDEGEIRPLFEGPSGVVLETFNEAVVRDPEPVEAPRPRLDLTVLDLSGRLLPALTVPRRLRTRLPGLAEMFGRAPDDLDTVMAAPEFRRPLIEALNRYDQEWIMPGVAAIQPHDMVTAMETNGRFVSSFLIGVNHEFARELVWREYPTDGRASSLRRFWTTEPDIAPIHTLRGPAGLGVLADPERAGKLVFVVRGELIRRFPHVIATVVRSTAPDYPVKYAAQPVEPIFRIPLTPDLLLAGFDLTDEVAKAQDPTTDPVHPASGANWFTLAEHIGAPRFGLDITEPEDPIEPQPVRDELTWEHWKKEGEHLNAFVPRIWPPRPPGNPPGVPEPEGTYTSARIAWALFQKPARVGWRVQELIGEG
ncbi:hypothetical protein ACI3KX_09495 [Microbacterium sp. ZW CA_36]|uniref:hypothetical protein n=1 Tax=Microbacterium sp. ZW CA_36 TaxID=3378078 RepID=UPI003851E1D8